MNTDDDNGGDPGERNDVVGRLLRVAGAREDPPREDYDQVFAAASAALQAKIGRNRRARGPSALAVAATVILGLGVFWTLVLREPASAAITTRVLGEVERRATGSSSWQPLRPPAASLAAGDALRTGRGGRVALLLETGPSLRLDEHTEITLDSASGIELRKGAVYVDSFADGRSRSPVEIVTAMGTARDVGTQFEVRLLDSRLRLRVREGTVALSHGSTTTTAAGEQLTLWSSGAIERAEIRGDDPEWRWIESLAVAPAGDSQPLTAILDWVERETGRPTRYSSADLERRARAVTLHGSLRDLAPLEALETALATTDLDYRIMDDGSILIVPR